MTKNKILNNITSESLKTEENSIKEILSTSVSTLSNFDTDIENIRIDLRKNLFPFLEKKAIFEKNEKQSKTDIKEELKPIFDISRLTSYLYELSGEVKSDHTGINKTQFGRIVESVVKECLILKECSDIDSPYHNEVMVYSDKNAKKTPQGDILSRYCSSPKWNKKTKEFEFKNDRISKLINECLVIEHQNYKEEWKKQNPDTKELEIVYNPQSSKIKCSIEMIATLYSKYFKTEKESETNHNLEVFELLTEINTRLEKELLSDENAIALISIDNRVEKAYKQLHATLKTIDSERLRILKADGEVEFSMVKKEIVNK